MPLVSQNFCGLVLACAQAIGTQLVAKALSAILASCQRAMGRRCSSLSATPAGAPPQSPRVTTALLTGENAAHSNDHSSLVEWQLSFGHNCQLGREVSWEINCHAPHQHPILPSASRLKFGMLLASKQQQPLSHPTATKSNPDLYTQGMCAHINEN
eukprot:3594346-Amphidinium_carterae.1